MPVLLIFAPIELVRFQSRVLPNTGLIRSSLRLFSLVFLTFEHGLKNQPAPLNLGNQANDEIIAMLSQSFLVTFDEGLMEDSVAKSPFIYNGKPVVSQANDSDLGEILSSALNIFRDAVDVKFSFIAVSSPNG